MEKGEKKQGRRTSTQEFKLEAVRLVRTGIPKARVAREPGRMCLSFRINDCASSPLHTLA
jgi:transposase-like protein